MAEVRQRFGKGAFNFTHRIYNRHLLESPNKRFETAAEASSPSSGILSTHGANGEPHGADTAADRVTAGASRYRYVRTTPVLGAVIDVRERGDVAEYYCCRGLKAQSLLTEAQVRIIETNLPRCRSNAKFRRTPCGSSPRSRRVCWVPGQVVFTRHYGGNGARSEPLYKTKTGYYDILEVLPTATQAQIKTAYYKQSFVYHPDRNAGSEEATVRFSEISEAYTVLGNKALRKKYDRGLLSQSDLNARARPSARDGAGGPAKQQADGRRSVVGADIRGGVFDFDRFFKSHYNEQLQRQREIRVRKEEMLKEKREAMGEKKLGRMMEVCVGVMLVMAVGIIISLKRG